MRSARWRMRNRVSSRIWLLEVGQGDVEGRSVIAAKSTGEVIEAGPKGALA